MNQFWSGDECEKAQTLTTTATGSKNSQEGVNSQVDYQNHNGPFTPLRTQLKSYTHSAINKLNSKRLRLVNLIENDAKSLSRPLAWLL